MDGRRSLSTTILALLRPAGMKRKGVEKKGKKRGGGENREALRRHHGPYRLACRTRLVDKRGELTKGGGGKKKKGVVARSSEELQIKPHWNHKSRQCRERKKRGGRKGRKSGTLVRI